MKKCTKCGVLKDEKEFIDDKGKVVKKCIKCREYRKEHYNRHKDRVKEQVKEYYERNKEQIKEYSKEYRVRNREYKKEYMKEYNKEYYERNKEYFKEYYARNREQIKEYGKEYGKEYRERNKVRVKEYDKEYRKSSAKYETYAHKLTVEESPKKGKRGELLARCTKCGKYFAPTRHAELVYHALAWSRGTFEFKAVPVEMRDEVGASTTQLLMEAARRHDEMDERTEATRHFAE